MSKFKVREKYYSLLSASIGRIFAALYAGKIPKKSPVPIENDRARRI